MTKEIVASSAINTFIDIACDFVKLETIKNYSTNKKRKESNEDDQ